jgi:hypothetical protein
LLRDTDISLGKPRLSEYCGYHLLPGDHSVSYLTHLIDGLFGLTAASSLAGFVFHLSTGNPDLALMCFVGIGGSAAIGWMFAACRRA